MKLTASLIKGGVCYLLSFALMLFVISRSKSNLVEGEQVDYERSFDFYIKASEKTGDHFIVSPELARGIEQRLSFRMNAPTTFQTSFIQVIPQDVSWKSGKTRYHVAGGRISFKGKLTAMAGAANAEQPLVIVLPDLPEGQWAFPNGGARGTGRERVVKNFHVHPSAAAVQSANQASAAKTAGSLALATWGVWLLISAWRVRKKRDAASEPLDQVQLPRTFEPNVPHIARSFGLAALIGGGIALIPALVGLDDPGSHLSDLLALVPAGVALAVAVLVAWIVSRRIVGAEFTQESLVLARGPGRGNRREIPWAAMDAAKPVQLLTPSGQVRKEYYDIIAPGTGKDVRIHSAHIAEYHLFRDLVSMLWLRHHPVPSEPRKSILS